MSGRDWPLIAFVSVYGVLIAAGLVAILSVFVGSHTRLVLLSDGHYEVQRCFMLGRVDCHGVYRTTDPVQATKEYEIWTAPAPPKPTIVEQIFP